MRDILGGATRPLPTIEPVVQMVASFYAAGFYTGLVGVSAMRHKLVPLLAVFALLLVAAGGATAAGDAGTNITSEETPDDSGDVGICLVGADSPCNDAPADDSAAGTSDDNVSDDGDQIGDNDPDEDGQMWIPEDQNRDGEIDDRFNSGDNENADSDFETGNGTTHIEPVPDQSTPPTHPTPVDGSTEIGSDDGTSDEQNQIWIPEDQNHDGEIDDRFLGGFGPFADVILPFVGGF